MKCESKKLEHQLHNQARVKFHHRTQGGNLPGSFQLLSCK